MKGIKLILAVVLALTIASMPINTYADGSTSTDQTDESANASGSADEAGDNSGDSGDANDADDATDDQPTESDKNSPETSIQSSVSEGVNGDGAGMGEYEPDPGFANSEPGSPSQTNPGTSHQSNPNQNTTPETNNSSETPSSTSNNESEDNNSEQSSNEEGSDASIPKAPNSDTSKINSKDNRSEGTGWDSFMRILAIVLLVVAILTITVALVVRGINRRREEKEKHQFD